eukprot:COSAG02_NODE_81_length_39811_cov_51.728898_32_plen_123_part_00
MRGAGGPPEPESEPEPEPEPGLARRPLPRLVIAPGNGCANIDKANCGLRTTLLCPPSRPFRHHPQSSRLHQNRSGAPLPSRCFHRRCDSPARALLQGTDGQLMSFGRRGGSASEQPFRARFH